MRVAASRAWGNGTDAIVSNFENELFENFRTRVSAEAAPLTLEEIFVAVAGEER
jgi:hypothetical protein